MSHDELDTLDVACLVENPCHTQGPGVLLGKLGVYGPGAH